MRSRPTLLFALAAGALASGCQTTRRPQDPAQAARAAECRAATDRAYRDRDRIAQFRPEQRDSPFSANYVPGNTASGLGELFGRDKMQADCLRNAGAGSAPDASTGPDFSTRSYQPQ